MSRLQETITKSRPNLEGRVPSYVGNTVKLYVIKSLPDDKILDWSKLKAFADNNLHVAQMMIYVFDREEKTLCEKEKMLVTIFSFSHNVCKSSLSLGR